MNEVYKTIGRHVNMNPKEDKLAAVQAIDCLLELDYDENENANKISKFGNQKKENKKEKQPSIILFDKS
jgi:hypothetical protein